MVDFKKAIAGKTTSLAEKSLDSPAKKKYLKKTTPQANKLQEGGFYKVPILAISPDPEQPRKHFDKTKLKELANSIKSKGVLQPVIIRKNGDEAVGTDFILVAGERRFRASKMAKLEEIPAILTYGDPAEIALIENLQRDDLKPVEEAEAYQRIIKSHNYSQRDLSAVVGKSVSSINEILALNKLPKEVKEDCRDANISKNALLEIAKRKDPEEMFSLYEKVKNGDFTVKKIRQLTRPKSERQKSLVEERAITKLKETKKLIPKINKEDLSPEYKAQLWEELNDLSKLMNTLLGE